MPLGEAEDLQLEPRKDPCGGLGFMACDLGSRAWGSAFRALSLNPKPLMKGLRYTGVQGSGGQDLGFRAALRLESKICSGTLHSTWHLGPPLRVNP